MSYIELTQKQVVDIVERELRMQMFSYYHDYDSPDVDTVKEIYTVWRMFATSDETYLFHRDNPDIWESVRRGR